MPLRPVINCKGVMRCDAMRCDESSCCYVLIELSFVFVGRWCELDLRLLLFCTGLRCIPWCLVILICLIKESFKRKSWSWF